MTNIDSKASVAYHVPAGIHIRGPIRIDRFSRAFRHAVERHSILRSKLGEEGKTWIELPDYHFDLPLTDFSDRNLQPGDEALRQELLNESREPFDLFRGPLFRARLFKLGQASYIFLITAHQIIIDGLSIGVFFHEIEECYIAFNRGQHPQLEDALQFDEYVRQLNEWTKSPAFSQAERYWVAKFKGEVPIIDLPSDYPRPALKTYNGALESLWIGEDLYKRVRELGRREGCSLFMALFAIFTAYIHRITGQEDLVIGIPVTGRTRETSQVVGYCTNMLAIRNWVSPSASVHELLMSTRGNLLEAFEHKDYAFSELLRKVNPPRDISRLPLTDILFNLDRAPDWRQWCGVEASLISVPMGAAAFDWYLNLVETPNGFLAELDYNQDLFTRDTCKALLRNFCVFLESATNESSAKINELTLLCNQERQEILTAKNSTERECGLSRSFIEIFEEQVSRRGEFIAVSCLGNSLSYRDLNERSNRLANYLRVQGVPKGTIVGVFLERSVELVVALLGIMKAGGVYLPLEPKYPSDRLHYMVEDSGIAILLTEEKNRNVFEQYVKRVICIDSEKQDIDRKSDSNPGIELAKKDLAYVIYTSGSTGKPKGVGLEQAGMLNHLYAMAESLELGENDVMAQTAPISFDISVWQFLMALLIGGKVEIVGEDEARDAVQLMNAVKGTGITVLECVPALLAAMLEEPADGHFGKLRWMISTGEALPWKVAKKWREVYPRIPLINAYGPAECCDDISLFRVSTDSEGQKGEMYVPIGLPLMNTKVYVFDNWLQAVPVGVAGELYIGGICVGRSYLNNPELTAQKFVPDPFGNESGERLYRTGDWVRWRRDGVLEFLGRVDHQVKIRGHRIELGEIETALRQNETVTDVAVIAAGETESGKRLVAYVVGRSKTEDSNEWFGELQDQLRSSLPAYMMPSAFIELSELPLTPNGKLDRKALPAPDWGVGKKYIEPDTSEEKILCGIWEEVLGVERVGVEDGFFELGGHSLLAMQVASRVRKVFGVNLALRALFEKPTVRGLAKTVETLRLQGREKDGFTRIVRGESLPLSFAQQRLWFLAQMTGVSEAYHLPLNIHLKGKLDRSALLRSLNRLVERHEALRTTFALIDGIPVQRISPIENRQFTLIEHDLRTYPDAAEECKRLVAEEGAVPFDLIDGPLIRGRLIQNADDEHMLLLIMHHIVSDGWSMGILFNELRALYSGYLSNRGDSLPELSLQYADYAVWQREWLDGEFSRQQSEYWKKELTGSPALLELPTDRARPAQKSYAGGFVELHLEEQLTASLETFSKQHGVTLFMTLLTAWAVLLFRLSGQEDIVIGTPVANRNRVEIEELIGFFVNTLALRLDLSGSPSVRELLAQVKTKAVNAQQHQDIPFEKVVEILRPERSLAYSPVFQTVFAWESVPSGSIRLPGLDVTILRSTPQVTSKFDLTLILEQEDTQISGGIEFSTSLFNRSTIERAAGYFLALLHAMVVDDSRTVDRLEILSECERGRVLYEWNATESDYRRDCCVHELFEEQAARTPDAVAVVQGERELSYGELNRQANRMAHSLRELGVRPDERVATLLGRSIELVVSELAILKCGAAYVPLDMAIPQERLEFMIRDSEAGVLLTAAAEELPGLSGVKRVDLDSTLLNVGKEENLGLRVASAAGAYVMYTSGSTGEPKGVLAQHAGILRLVLKNGYAEFTPADRVGFAANPAFDATTLEVWAPLLNGGRIVVIGQEDLLEPRRFGDRLREQGVDVLWLTVGLFNQYVDELREEFGRLRYLIVGGDALDVRTIGRLLEGNRPRHLLNGYGPTETTTFAAAYEKRVYLRRAEAFRSGVRSGIHGSTFWTGTASLFQRAWRASCISAERALRGDTLDVLS